MPTHDYNPAADRNLPTFRKATAPPGDVAPRRLPTLWQLRCEAWAEGVSARELWRIARFYRRQLRMLKRRHSDGSQEGRTDG